MVRVAINGFGRIGRTFLRSAFDSDIFEVVAINDLGNLDNLAYLLEHDSVYGHSPFTVAVTDNELKINDRTITFLQERNPEKLPWRELEIDIVVEATGFFTTYAAAKDHLTAGAKRVVISAPAKDDPTEAGVKGSTVLVGVNDEALKTCDISSNASCTTNAISPLIAVLDESIGIEKAILNTVHAYTATQSLVDKPHKKDPRKGRAAALNIIPATTGAAIATTTVHTQLDDKFDGMALRVPVPVGSVVDVTFIAKQPTTVEAVNAALAKAAKDKKWKGIFTATTDPIVSSDIIGSRVGSIADLSFTKVVGGNLVKVLSWYDNETSYTETLIIHVARAAEVLTAKSRNDTDVVAKEKTS